MFNRNYSLNLLLLTAMMLWGVYVSAQVRILSLDTGTETVTLKNFGGSPVDLSSYNFCLGPGNYNQLNNYTNITGSLYLTPNSTVAFDLTSSGGNVQALPDTNGGLALFINPVFGSNSPNDLGDYVQWGASNQPRVNQAVLACRWDNANNFVTGAAPFTYTGNATDFGSTFWVGTTPANVRILRIDPINETVTLKNFGGTAEDVSGYNFCLGPGNYNQLSNYTYITGSLNLSPNATVIIDLTSSTGNVAALPDANGALALFINPTFGSSSPADLGDYVQWGAANQPRVGQAVTAGRWDNVYNFVSGAAPYYFVGGGADVGASFWNATTPARVRIVNIDTQNETVTLKNFGGSAEDLSAYNFCLGPGQYNQLNAYSNITGSLNLAPNGVAMFDLTSGSGNVQALPDANGGLALFINPVFGSNSANDIADYVQWGAANQPRVGQAVNAGRWDDVNNFVSGNSPFAYNGDADDIGASFWSGAAAPARVRLLSLDTQAETVTLKNFGGTTEDLSGYNFCLGPGQYNQLSDYSNITGSLNLAPGDEVTFDLTSGSGNVQALPDANGGLTLFINPVFGSNSAVDIADYVQWGAANQPRVGQSVNAGRWTSAIDFVQGQAPYVFVGGQSDIGSSRWIDNTAIRMSRIIPEGDTIVIENFDTVDRNIGNYFFCTQAGVYPQLGNPAEVEIVSGDLDLAPGEEVTIRVLTVGGVLDIGSIFLFSTNVLGFNNQNAAVTRDFAQWGVGNGFRVGNAVAIGRWDDSAAFIDGQSPFDYIGGAEDVGSTFWIATPATGIGAPTNLGILYDTQFLPVLNWTDNANNEDGFTIERRVGSGAFEQVGTLGTDATSFTDTTTAFGVDVTYRVQAFNVSDVSSFSNEATFQQPGIIQDLDLNFVCFDPATQKLNWEVTNPNSISIFYIYATWNDNPRQQDTLFAPPGVSSFTTQVAPLDTSLSFDANTTGIYWIDQTLSPGFPKDEFGDDELINLGQACVGRGIADPSPVAPEGVFEGVLGDIIRVVTNIDESEVRQRIQLMPNPTTGWITIQSVDGVGSVELNVRTMTGQLVLRQSVDLSQSQQVDLSSLARGIYTVELRNAQLIEVIKIVKQ
ncbi:MAG: T9SS type A sorting domain-containing protein [Bacteroidota bacterium]